MAQGLTEVGSSYCLFEDLEPTRQQLEVVHEMLQSADWKLAFLGIDQLRAIAKFRWEELLSGWDQVSSRVIELADSPRSSLSKNTLLFFSECFLLPRPGVDLFAHSLLAVILVKAVNEKSFIRSTAVQALQNLAANSPPDLAVELLSGFCFHKSGAICDLAFTSLQPLLVQAPPPVAFRVCLTLLNSKRKRTIVESTRTLQTLRDSWEGFGESVDALEIREKDTLNRQLNASAGTARKPLREFLREAKTETVQPEFRLV